MVRSELEGILLGKAAEISRRDAALRGVDMSVLARAIAELLQVPPQTWFSSSSFLSRDPMISVRPNALAVVSRLNSVFSRELNLAAVEAANERRRSARGERSLVSDADLDDIKLHVLQRLFTEWAAKGWPAEVFAAD